MLHDQSPLAQIHTRFVPDSPAVLEAGQTSFRSSFAWSNTLNRHHDGYWIDAETRELRLHAEHTPVERLQLGASLPLYWRGGGVLDSPISSWHRFWGLPEGPRDDSGVEDNRYDISGENEDDSSFNLPADGLEAGDLRLAAKYLFSDGNEKLPALSLTGSLSVPTGAQLYGQNGVDASAGLLAAKRFSDWIIYAGGGYSYFSDDEQSGITFTGHSANGFIGAEYEVSTHLSVICALSGGTSLVESIRMFPDYETYLDTGLKYQLTDGYEVELLIRENPAPSRGTTDFTFAFGVMRKL